MKRYQKLLSLIGFSGILWFLLLNEFFTPLSPKSKSIVQVLPLYALITFGCYSLATIGYNLMTFPECEHESKLLEKEREEAIRELKLKGIEVIPPKK